MLLALQGMDLSGQLHGVSAEVVHGDGVVPVTEVVLLTRRLLLPPHAAHRQQHRNGGNRHTDCQHDPHNVHHFQADGRRGQLRVDGGAQTIINCRGLAGCGGYLSVEKVPAVCGGDLRAVSLSERVLGPDRGTVGEQACKASYIPLLVSHRWAVCAVTQNIWTLHSGA